jgi:hypothetical protein
MGRETGRRNGLAFGVLGPLGIILLALLPSWKASSAAVQRLEGKGAIGLRIRRETLAPNGGNVASFQGGWKQQIRDDVTASGGDDDSVAATD